MQYKKIEKSGYNFHFLNSNKFKTIRVSLKFRRELKREEATKRALLSLLFMNGTEKFPTKKDISRYLEELYGANVSTSIFKKGNANIMSINLTIPNERYLEEDVLEKGLDLIHDMIFNVRFDETSVNQEKRELQQKLQAIYDDKMRYSLRKLIRVMGEGEPFAINADGYIEDLESITIDDLKEYYNDVIKNDIVDIFVVGDIGENVHELLDNYFKFEPNHEPFEVIGKSTKEVREVRVEKEVQRINQGKLNIGYRANVTAMDDDYYAMQVFNGIFGGFAHSKLFLNVREKESLCYYVGSRYDSYNGLIVVFSGIEFENYDKAVNIIREQLDAMRNGDITDSEIEQTKAMIENGMLESFDSMGGVIDFYYANELTQRDLTIDEWISGMEKVTKDDLIKIGEKVHEDTIFYLTGENE